MSFLDDFIWRAVIAGAGVALVAGPLGCFVVWRRMAYFGDTVAHSSLLGVALGLLLGFNVMLGVFAAGFAVALVLSGFLREKRLSGDTVLGTLSHASLSLGVIVISLMTWLRVDLMGYLFGDILAVSLTDLYWVYGGGMLVLVLLVLLWRPLLAVTVDQELARAEGIDAARYELMLIIPAAAARRLSRTPEQMALMAAFVGVLSVLLGLFASFQFDTPSGPSIVLASLMLFLLGQIPSFRKP